MLSLIVTIICAIFVIGFLAEGMFVMMFISLSAFFAAQLIPGSYFHPPEWSWQVVHDSLGYVVAYFALGVMWAFIHWPLYIRSKATRVIEKINDRKERRGDISYVDIAGYVNTEFAELIPTWTNADKVEVAMSAGKSVLSDIVIQPKKARGLICAWILIWPFSIVAYMISDIVFEIGVVVLSTFRNVFAAAARWAMNSVDGVIEK